MAAVRRALVFSGQGSQIKGMGFDTVSSSPKARKLWEKAEDRIKGAYGISLTEVIRDNPPWIMGYERCQDPDSFTPIDGPVNYQPESTPRIRKMSHEKGVISLTHLTQPATLLAQSSILEAIEERHNGFLSSISVFAGHSLGEFTALTAMKVLPIDIAVDLVYRRGVLMENALKQGSLHMPSYMMYAVNPSRAKLGAELSRGEKIEEIDPEDVFVYMVELIALKLRRTTSWVEVVNYNVSKEQIVVAGDEVGLSILGKCLDPLSRANAVEYGNVQDFNELVTFNSLEVLRDLEEGFNDDPNAPPPPDYVPASWHKVRRDEIFQRRRLTLDDGHTLPLERLTHLTLEDNGKSGLKKKSWFIPLPIDIPFHSSFLRKAMDQFYDDCLSALPSDDIVTEKLLGNNHWVTNLTGTSFSLGNSFLDLFSEVVRSQNIGENSHHGKYHSKMTELFLKNAEDVKQRVVDQGAIRKFLASIICAQLAHPVLWADTMKHVVDDLQCQCVLEISPQKTLVQMFNKSNFNCLERPKVLCLPSEEIILFPPRQAE
eukprot:Tbor_TRINITY_DN6061_c5_g4::TRINITY_DN6061_c5_g4_i1::g.11504::m.11504